MSLVANAFPVEKELIRMWEIVNDISEGKGEDIELLEELARIVKDASMCALGQTVSNPVLSTLRYFRKEYEAHIRDKKCPAGVCKELIQYFNDEEKCTGCLACIKPCPQGAITGELKKLHSLDQSKCIKCGAYYESFSLLCQESIVSIIRSAQCSTGRFFIISFFCLSPNQSIKLLHLPERIVEGIPTTSLQ